MNDLRYNNIRLIWDDNNNQKIIFISEDVLSQYSSDSLICNNLSLLTNQYGGELTINFADLILNLQ